MIINTNGYWKTEVEYISGFSTDMQEKVNNILSERNNRYIDLKIVDEFRMYLVYAKWIKKEEQI